MKLICFVIPFLLVSCMCDPGGTLDFRIVNKSNESLIVTYKIDFLDDSTFEIAPNKMWCSPEFGYRGVYALPSPLSERFDTIIIRPKRKECRLLIDYYDINNWKYKTLPLLSRTNFILKIESKDIMVTEDNTLNKQE